MDALGHYFTSEDKVFQRTNHFIRNNVAREDTAGRLFLTFGTHFCNSVPTYLLMDLLVHS